MGGAISKLVGISSGLLYPAYRSYKALDTNNAPETKQWLTYWTLFALTSAVETVSDRVVWWFPGYQLIKTGFLIYLATPSGATHIYRHYVRPFFKQHERGIDEGLAQLQRKGKMYMEILKKEGTTVLKQKLDALSKDFQDGEEYLRPARGGGEDMDDEEGYQHVVANAVYVTEGDESIIVPENQTFLVED